MKRILPFISLIILVIGCDNPSTTPDCSTILCAYNPVSIKIKYVDKNTNNELIKAGSTYKLTDLKVTRGIPSNYTPEISLDQTNNSIILINHVFSGDILLLGNLSSDKITIETKKRSNECCSAVDIISLKINDEILCAPCSDLDKSVFTIKK